MQVIAADGALLDEGQAGKLGKEHRLHGTAPGDHITVSVTARFEADGGFGSADCTPGYYNNEGQDAGPAKRFFVGYPHGAMAFFSYLDTWRSSGEFEGLEFRSPGADPG